MYPPPGFLLLGRDTDNFSDDAGETETLARMFDLITRGRERQGKSACAMVGTPVLL